MVTTRAALEDRGFTGFVPFAELAAAGVPQGPGVYAVLRMQPGPPAFLSASTACGRRGRSATVETALLTAKWVDGVEVVYLGKATAGTRGRRGLSKRLAEYHRHGIGQRPGHWGGRYIWQLADPEELIVAWLETKDDASRVEGELIGEFLAATGRLPFANLKQEGVQRARTPTPHDEVP